MFASIHLPKCAGNSLKKALARKLRHDVVFDYGDAINDYSERAILRRYRSRSRLAKQVSEGKFNPCMVHGHFYAPKYLGLGIPLQWMTIFREPKDLLYSYYNYLKRAERNAPIIEKVKAIDSFEDFVEDRDFQNIMARMIYPLNVDDFEYIGLQEEYELSLQGIQRLLGRGKLAVTEANVNPAGSTYELSPDLTRRIADLNRCDLDLMEAARSRFHRQHGERRAAPVRAAESPGGPAERRQRRKARRLREDAPPTDGVAAGQERASMAGPATIASGESSVASDRQADSADQMRAVFDRKYEQNLWSGGLADGTRSGRGSTMDATRPFREFLQAFVPEHGVQTLLDAPCGDFHWMKEVTFPASFRYLGGDVSEVLVKEISEKYESPSRHFFRFDIVNDRFPDADVWLCRDCLFHLPLDLGVSALRNGLTADVKYMMITSHYDVDENLDCEIGRVRRLDLMKPPFSLPEPEARCDEFVGTNRHRYVGVWKTSGVREALS